MKKLVNLIACFLICFSVQAQTQSGKTQNVQGGDKPQVTRTGDAKDATHNCADHKGGEKAVEATNPHSACPKAATCPKAQAASNQDAEQKPCCAKHQENKTDADAKTEQKAGCNHQSADQKAKCNHNSDANSSCPKKTEEKK